MRISHVCFSANHLRRASRTSVGERSDLSLLLIEILVERHIYLPQTDLANLMNHERAAISKACKRIREENPQLWEAYLQNKGKPVRKP